MIKLTGKMVAEYLGMSHEACLKMLSRKGISTTEPRDLFRLLDAIVERRTSGRKGGDTRTPAGSCP